jgi:hypothetical protein
MQNSDSALQIMQDELFLEVGLDNTSSSLSSNFFFFCGSHENEDLLWINKKVQ